MSKVLIAATSSAHKVKEISAILPEGWQVKSLKDVGFEGEIIEDGLTLEENALIKARALYAILHEDVFAEDTGLEVSALDNTPGVNTARYAGEERSDSKNIALLLHNLSDKTNRKARFRTVIALIKGGFEYLFEGIVEGQIAVSPQGEGGFGYDPIFIPEGHKDTFAVLSSEIKNTISHRARAVSKLVAFLQKSENDLATQKIEYAYDLVSEPYGLALKDELQEKHFDRMFLQSFAEQSKAHGPMLDIGCGPGQTTNFLTASCGVEDILGIDISKGMIEQAQKMFPSNRFMQASMFQLPFSDDTFGSVLGFYAIVNFDYNGVKAALEETFRVLKPGGSFGFSFHIGDHLNPVDILFGVEINLDFYFFKVENIKAISEDVGFKIVDIVERLPYPEKEYPSRRAYFWLEKPLTS